MAHEWKLQVCHNTTKEISRFEPEFAQNLKRKLAQFGQSIDDMPSNINPSRI